MYVVLHDGLPAATFFSILNRADLTSTVHPCTPKIVWFSLPPLTILNMLNAKERGRGIAFVEWLHSTLTKELAFVQERVVCIDFLSFASILYRVANTVTATAQKREREREREQEQEQELALLSLPASTSLPLFQHVCN